MSEEKSREYTPEELQIIAKIKARDNAVIEDPAESNTCDSCQ